MDHYKNMAHYVRYTMATTYMPLILETSKSRLTRWWINTAYRVHLDMNIHYGGIMSLGKGSM